MSAQSSNIVGAFVSISINLLLIALFLARLSHKPKVEYAIGILVILNVLPLLCLLFTAMRMKRPFLYFLQLGFMIAYLILELVLDYILRIDFRQNLKIVIPYVMLFFSGTGGMVGIASQAGKGWLWASAITFLLMTALSIGQRFITGQ